MAVKVDKPGKERRQMHENRNLCPLRPPLGCIEVHTNPARRVYVSGMPAEKTDRPSKAEKAVNVLSGLISSGCCLAMVYLVARLV